MTLTKTPSTTRSPYQVSTISQSTPFLFQSYKPYPLNISDDELKHCVLSFKKLTVGDPMSVLPRAVEGFLKSFLSLRDHNYPNYQLQRPLRPFPCVSYIFIYFIFLYFLPPTPSKCQNNLYFGKGRKQMFVRPMVIVCVFRGRYRNFRKAGTLL